MSTGWIESEGKNVAVGLRVILYYSIYLTSKKRASFPTAEMIAPLATFGMARLSSLQRRKSFPLQVTHAFPDRIFIRQLELLGKTNSSRLSKAKRRVGFKLAAKPSLTLCNIDVFFAMQAKFSKTRLLVEVLMLIPP
jgi:hypothetical protein